jgi:DNA oxidative demethylase
MAAENLFTGNVDTVPLYEYAEPGFFQKMVVTGHDGFLVVKNFLTVNQQKALVKRLWVDLASDVGLYVPAMPKHGTPFNVQQTNFGPLGWVSDANGYRYQPLHPLSQKPWAKPEIIKALQKKIRLHLGANSFRFDSWLVNYYEPGKGLGMHRDKDEEVKKPIYCISLGAAAFFRISKSRAAKPAIVQINSGDLYILDGDARDSYHGVTVAAGPVTTQSPNPLLSEFPGRLSLTARQVFA